MAEGIEETRDSWPLLAGNPALYLECLRTTKTTQAVYPPHRLAWPDGKKAFGDFVRAHGGRTPLTLASITDGIAQSTPAETCDATAFVTSLPDGQYFCKPEYGVNGRGAMRLELTSGRTLVNDAEVPAADVAAVLSSAPYILQESLVPRQHPAIARFRPNVLNTIRLITFDAEEGAVPFHAGLKLATTSTTVDNWASGGVYVPIDIGRGVLRPFGFVKEGLARRDRHEPSGIRFKDQPVPHLAEALRLACDLHTKLAAPSLGWDIALLADGPCIVECNRFWDVYLPEELEPGYTAAFLRFHLPEVQEGAIRVRLAGRFDDRDALRRWLSLMLGSVFARGRVDHCSREDLVLTASGSSAALNRAIRLLAKPPTRFCVRGMKVARVRERLAPGLDIAATFHDASGTVQQGARP